MSITRCLKKLGSTVHKDDAAQVKELAKTFRDEGMDGAKAGVTAANDVLTELKDYRKEIAKQIEEKGGEAPNRSALANKQQATEKQEETKKKTDSKQAEKIEDFGEKIGGARKDTAERGYRMKTGKKDDRPAWMRRYLPMEIVADMNDPDAKGKWTIHDNKTDKPVRDGYKVKYYETEEEAINTIPLVEVSRNHIVRVSNRDNDEYGIYRTVSNRKRPLIKDGFKSREEAMQYMAKNPIEIIEHKTRLLPTIRPELENVKRTGKDYRNGKIATSKMFGETFGFRGVEFGNWNNQAERQVIMDHAYDALMDLANIVGVDPRALSLNGELALAFGARGHGLQGAAAHYERNYAVINLTKLQGAGALAHEWMHSVDHYFGRQDGKASSEKEESSRGGKVYKAKSPEKDYVSHGFRYNSEVRDEAKAAWKDIIQTIFKKSKEYVEDTHQVKKWSESAGKSLDQRIQNIRRGLTEELTWKKRNNKPATTEQLAEFDRLTDKMKRGEGMEEKFIPSTRSRSGGTYSTDTLNEISALYKKIRGQTGLAKHGVLQYLLADYRSYKNAIDRANDAEQSVKKTRTIGTDFYHESGRIDQGQAKDYWSTKHEMLARAFEAYIEDKVSELGENSQFLAHGADNKYYKIFGVKPYPEGEERTNINKSFDKLFNTLETKETDKGVAFYSNQTSPQKGISIEAAEKAIAPAILAVHDKVGLDVHIVPDNASLPVSVEPGRYPKGLFYEGKVYIVAGNLTSKKDAQITFSHEVVGHVGIDAVMGDKWDSVVKRVKWLNKTGNKEAKSIHDEIERRYGDVDDSTYASEFIAVAVERQVKEGAIAALLRKIRTAIRKFLKSLGLKAIFPMSDVDSMIKESQEYLRTGKGGKTEQNNLILKKKSKKENFYDWAARSGYSKEDLKDSSVFIEAQKRYAKEVESEVDSADVHSLTITPSMREATVQGQPLFSQNNNKIISASMKFAGQITDYLAGKLKVEKTIELGETPLILQKLGFNNSDLKMDQSIAHKAIKGVTVSGTKRHSAIDENAIKQLVIQLNDPVAVFNSESKDTALVVLTELQDTEGNPVIAIVDQNMQDGVTSIKVNKITSVYGKEKKDALQRWINNELRYVNTKKAPDFTALIGVQFSKNQLNQGRDKNIVTEKDLVKNQPQFSMDEPPYVKRMREGAKKEPPEKPPSAPPVYSMPSDGQFDSIIKRIYRKTAKFRYVMQDKFIDLKHIQEEVGDINDEQDAYMQEPIWQGRAGERMLFFEEERINPMLEKAAETDMSMEEIDNWLWARHAKEANKQLESINPDRENNDRLSGMSNEEAEAVLDKYKGNSALNDLGKMVDQINNERIELMLREGLIAQEEIDAWKAVYQHYVPLKREEAKSLLPPRGQGFNIRGQESKRRLGSTKPVENVIANVVAQFESSIIRAEKNRVGKSLLNFVESHNDESWWTLDVQKQSGAVKDGEVQWHNDPREYDNELKVKIDGKIHTVTFNESNERAMRIVSAMKNLDQGQIGALVKLLLTVNRYLASINTSWAPEFVISNFARDFQTAAYNMSDTDLKNFEVQVLKSVPGALKGLRANLRKGDKTSEWGEWAHKFRMAGGKTGWIDHYRDISDRRHKLEKELKRIQKGKTGKSAVMNLIKMVEDYNSVVENGVRLAAFRKAVETGMSEKEAAALAKNLTVNFNRRGMAGPTLNALYLFYNASIQGSTRLLQAMISSSKGRKLALATIGVAAVMDIINRSLSGDDDDGENIYDSLPEHIKSRYWIFMGEKEPLVKIPLPWGYNVLHTIGQQFGSMATGDDFDALESTADITLSILESFNPIGHATFLQTIAPTISDPFVQIGENKSWTGAPLKPEPFPFGPEKPQYQQHWSKHDRSYTKDFTKALNDWSGGDEIRPGFINISPEYVELIAEFGTGSAGRFVKDSYMLAHNLVTGDDIELNDVPMLRKVHGYDSQYGLQSRYYEYAEDVQYAAKQMKELKGQERQKARSQSQTRLIGQEKLTRSKLRELSKKKKAIEAKDYSDEIKKQKLEKIEEKIRLEMAKFNKRYREKVLN